MAVKVAVTKNLVAVKGPQVAVVSGGSGSEGLPGSGNLGPCQTTDRKRQRKNETDPIVEYKLKK